MAGRVRWLVTGSFVAYRVAPVAASAMLMVYTDDVKGLADALGLLPADSGADTVLLSPNDECVWDRLFEAEDIPTVGLSQAAADCLTGNGRMPSEGVALLEWMSEHEDHGGSVPSVISEDVVVPDPPNIASAPRDRSSAVAG